MTLDQAILNLEVQIKSCLRNIKRGNRVGRNQRALANSERLLAALKEVKQLPHLFEGDPVEQIDNLLRIRGPK